MLLKVVLSAIYNEKNHSSSYSTPRKKSFSQTIYKNMHFVPDQICLIPVSNNIWTKRSLC